MPELIEAEYYRSAAAATVGRCVATVEVTEPDFVRGDASAAELVDAVVGTRVAGVRRIGKMVVLDVAGVGGERRLGLRFGMTGRLLVDGAGPIDRLEYSSDRNDPAWDRLIIGFTGRDHGDLRLRDQRRLGSVELDPDETRFGADATDLDGAILAAAFSSSRTALKTRLLDQGRVAGLGNLLVDESLWRAGMDPARPCAALSADELDLLAATVMGVIAELGARGGSHRGDLQEQRHPAGRCPLDGAPLDRRSIGGRTTYWCPTHQH